MEHFDDTTNLLRHVFVFSRANFEPVFDVQFPTEKLNNLELKTVASCFELYVFHRLTGPLVTLESTQEARVALGHQAIAFGNLTLLFVLSKLSSRSLMEHAMGRTDC